MSHYAVAVFSDDADFDRLLKPYDENNKEEFVFEPVSYDSISEDFEGFKEANKGWTLENYMEQMGYTKEDGQYGYWHNPHGYWDWYSLDGKDYMFDLKRGVKHSGEAFRKNDYKWFKPDMDEVIAAEEFWDKYIDGDCTEDYPSIFTKDYYRRRYRTKKQYLKECSRTIPYAFITPDGVWHSAGVVGWFGASDETAESADRYAAEWEEYIRSDGNPYVNLVDCHI